MTVRRPVLLVVAKAPVPGEVKTRLVGAFTVHQAAALAAAALLDTLDACREAARRCDAAVVVALSGDVREGVAADSVATALAGVRVIPQRGAGLDQRLAHAHADAAGEFGTCLQLGMDTPQASPDLLASGLARVTDADGPDAVLGPAEDGGWWALGLRRAGAARCLLGVPMSTSRTGRATWTALAAECRRVERLPALRDVDTPHDVPVVARAAAGRFADLARALIPAAAW